jgi:hypothetical protein
MKTLSFSIAFFVAVLSTHSETKASTPSERMRHVIPQQGTVFINTYFATDSAGNVPPQDSTDPQMPDDTIQVATTASVLRGRPNSIAITAYAHPDTTYLSYASNGDIWILNSGKAQGWARLPFGTLPGKVVRTSPKSDTGHVLGNFYALYKHDEMQVVGWDTIPVAGIARVPVVQLRILTVMKYDKKRMHGRAPSEEYRNATTYWYAPSLGYFTKISFGWDTKYFLNQELKSMASANTTTANP